MCCFFTTVLFLGPRAAILVWWLIEPLYYRVVFKGFVWPLLGLIFAPWTTLMYLIVAPGGVFGLDWLWLGTAIFADLATYAGGGYGNRSQIREYTG
ncbi:MAG: hypothetical protein U9R53_02740 [Chloroflexota bacterium]|nr:hypothetical protein [Chloroflexota bacterium]